MLEAQWPSCNLLFWNLLLCAAYTGWGVMTTVLTASISLSHVIIRTMWSLQVTVALCWSDPLDRTTTFWLTDPSNDVVSKDFAHFCCQMADDLSASFPLKNKEFSKPFNCLRIFIYYVTLFTEVAQLEAFIYDHWPWFSFNHSLLLIRWYGSISQPPEVSSDTRTSF